MMDGYYKGMRWNESHLYRDPVTRRNVRQITTKGAVNTIPSYHTAQSFSAGGEEVIFISYRNGNSILCMANLLTGDITCLTDPVDGIGGLSESGSFGNGKGIPIGAVLAPMSRWAYYVVERQIRAVHLDTLEERVVVEAMEKDGFIESLAISPDETRLVYLVDVLGKPEQGLWYHLYSIAPEEGVPEVLLSEKGLKGDHVMFNPVDSDLLLLCRDTGPSPSNRVNGHGRGWIYRISERKLTEIMTVEPQNFQTHLAWTWDGTGIIYHGMIRESDWKNNVTDGGWYIGLAGTDGKTLREYSFPEAAYYGHISSMKGRNAAIIDGNIMDGLLMWLYFDEELPGVEIIARHDTDFTTMPGQYSHPHAICDPTGRRIVFNSARRAIFTGARSDIFVVEV